jgi:uncharacterized protein
MQIYLPIAEMPINILLILALGLVTGFLAGTFGIGGGFLATPFLIFIGIPPAISVATSANQIIASSVSGLFAHLKKGSVDLKMGVFLLIGGIIGSSFGVSIFKILQDAGHIDLVIGITYVLFLGSISILMLKDSSRVLMRTRYRLSFTASDHPEEEENSKIYKKMTYSIDRLPYKIYFPKSDIEVSAILPIFLSIIIGVLVSLMGIGGGFLMIPAMIYILRMPSSVVVGTSLFQIIFIASNTTFLQAFSNHTVDIVLAFLMIISSAIGAQIGTRAGRKMDGDKMRFLLSILLFLVCFKMFLTLFTRPDNLFLIELLK